MVSSTPKTNIMLSSLQDSVSYILKQGQQRFTRLKIQLYEEYILLFYMTLVLIIGNLMSLIWPILMFINFKLSMFLAISYYTWVLYDSRTLNTEGRRYYWVKNLSIFNWSRDYFPIRLVKTAELPAGRPYILAAFPHGILPFGGFFNYTTNINKTQELFPGHDCRLVLLNIFFYIPIARELLMALGCCTSNKENIKYLLGSNPPKTIAVGPGGVKEMLSSHPGSKYTIVKENRKGFVKIALETGSSLVPVFTFGEHNVYDQVNISSKFLDNLIYRAMRFKPVLPIGRGFFQKKFGLLPRRHPLTTVVGKPVPVPKVENPSSALIDEYHKRFHLALRNLFEENKHMYDEFGDDATLEAI